MNHARAVRPGMASVALLLILAITAAWWALALWPAGLVEPEWLLRTRAVCFGSTPGGLPDAGGWIVLFGEPLGMLGMLCAVWGRALREDLQRLYADWRWRPALLAITLASVFGVVKTGQRVTFVAGSGEGDAKPLVQSGYPTPVDVDATPFTLIDQHGRPTSLADFRNRPVLLTFAFGHCATVCPVVVHDVRIARIAANRPEVPLVVITLDPWRDTPAQLPAVADAWELGPQDRVLSGNIDDVQRMLTALGVERRRNERTGDIEHMSVVMTTDNRGRVRWRLDAGVGHLSQLLATIPER